jgi:hypothetical protein
MARLTDREHETARLGITPGTVTGPVSDDEALDWRWVGEPESWMGLRSERAMAYRPNSAAVSGGEPGPDRFAACLARSLLSLFRG